MSSSLISSKILSVRAASRANSVATPLSSGIKTSQLFSRAYFIISNAVSAWSGSYSEFPTFAPVAWLNVVPSAPPIINLSAIRASARNTPIFVDILDPATIATNGRAGCTITASSWLISDANNLPA